jgi:hypothetical protein
MVSPLFSYVTGQVSQAIICSENILTAGFQTLMVRPSQRGPDKQVITISRSQVARVVCSSKYFAIAEADRYRMVRNSSMKIFTRANLNVKHEIGLIQPYFFDLSPIEHNHADDMMSVAVWLCELIFGYSPTVSVPLGRENIMFAHAVLVSFSSQAFQVGTPPK